MRRADGFTLIELLVVMVLMAILSAAAIGTISFTFGDEEAETEARRIAALVSLAAEEALLTGREIGMQLEDESLSFWFYDDVEQRWLPLETDGPFRRRTLPETLRSELVLEGRQVLLETGDEDEQEGDGESMNDIEQPEPQVLMFSSGQVTPFSLLLESETAEQAWRIETDLLGRVKVEAVE